MARHVDCPYCKAKYYTKEPEHIHQCRDGGEAMRKAHRRPAVLILRAGEEVTIRVLHG